MIKKHTTGKKPKAQAMVEFALVLLLLLTLLYGILEAGRLLFIYASTVTAARQAVRYGSTTGLNADGVPYYLDCAGIREAAKRVGFINVFLDEDIHITYDAGLDPSAGYNPKDITGYPDADDYAADACDGNTNLQSLIANGYRVRVQVSTDWTPISPIVPLSGFTITKQSARTILVNVSVKVTAAPQGWSGNGTGDLSLAISASPATYYYVGQKITYEYTLKNEGDADLSAPFGVTAGKAPSTCAGAPGTLAPGASIICYGYYYITQADLDGGSVLLVAQATASGSSSGNASATVMAVQSPALTIAKSASPTIASSVGTVITYTYTLQNTGNVTLSYPYSITDNKIGAPFNCSYTGTLAPNATVSCTATYSITGTDMNAGEVVNQATATAQFKTTTVTSANTATAKVITSYLVLSVSATPQTATQPNQLITYTYVLYNNSGSTLNSLSVSDTKGSVTCASSSISPNTSTSCTRTYLVSQAEMDAGVPITSHVTASANGGTVVAPAVDTSVAVVQSAVLSLSISVAPSTVLIANTPVIYTYTLTNSGNVTLSPAYSIADDKFGTVPCILATTLIPGASTICTKTYTITQTDIDTGPFINKATASAIFNGQTITSTQQFAAVATYNGPRLSLSKSPNINPVTTGNGTVVTYTYTLQNTGNVPLTSPYAVTDNKIPSVSCASAKSPLVVGDTTTCSGSYTVTSADVIAGFVTNQATATAKNGATTISSNQATVTVYTSGPIACYVYHRSSTPPSTSITFPTQKTMRITITNSSSTATTIHIGSIQLFNWNASSPAGQYISNISFGGKTTVIYTGSSADNSSPITFSTFSGDVSLTPGASKVLEFTFNKNYSSTNNERIMVSFLENGCPQLDTDNSSQVGTP